MRLVSQKSSQLILKRPHALHRRRRRRRRWRWLPWCVVQPLRLSSSSKRVNRPNLRAAQLESDNLRRPNAEAALGELALA